MPPFGPEAKKGQKGPNGKEGQAGPKEREAIQTIKKQDGPSFISRTKKAVFYALCPKEESFYDGVSPKGAMSGAPRRGAGKEVAGPSPGTRVALRLGRRVGSVVSSGGRMAVRLRARLACSGVPALVDSRCQSTVTCARCLVCKKRRRIDEREQATMGRKEKASEWLLLFSKSLMFFS